MSSDSDESSSSDSELEALIGPYEPTRPDSEIKRTRKWVHFGPVYGEDSTDANNSAKESAWQHILGGNGTGGGARDDENGTINEQRKQCLMSSIEEIGREALEGYDASTVRYVNSQPWQYVWYMMARDGCFFLQLALHILGAGELLGYPSDHPVFGENCDTLGLWTPAMFWSGNQIPYNVIDALMNQPFFKNVIDTKPDWERPTEEEAAKLALYQTVVEPQLTTTKTKKSSHHRPPSFNVLTALRNVLLGTDDEDPALAEMREFKDLELGTSDSLVRFPSATELNRTGVNLIKKSGIRVSNIRFKNRGYSATLYLPPFHIHNHTHTIHVMTNLVQHEKRLTEMDREVTSYVRFMRDLAPTYKDFKMLQDKGIIQVREQGSSGKVIYKLHDLVSSNPSNFTPKFNDILRGIKEYETVPWHRISFTCSIACGIMTFFLAVFTVAQTVFTALSYYR